MSDKTFEKSITELEKIVAQLEKGDLSLDEMLKQFEDGIALSRSCNKMLNEAEKRINVLVKKGGEIEKQEFNSIEE